MSPLASVTRESFPSARDEIVLGSSSWRHTLGTRSKYNLNEEDTDLGIVATLMALLADHVMGIVATTRRSYLTEFNRLFNHYYFRSIAERSNPTETLRGLYLVEDDSWLDKYRPGTLRSKRGRMLRSDDALTPFTSRAALTRLRRRVADSVTIPIVR